MPHPARIDATAITTEARRLLEEAGIEGVSMRELARRLGVRAPSLYFHVESRDDLLRELIALGLAELGEAMANVPPGPDVHDRFHAMAVAYANFGTGNPNLFALMFGPCPDERKVDSSLAQLASEPVLAAVRDLGVAENAVVDVAQALWALVHGYTVLALGGHFLLGGDPLRALLAAVDALIDGSRRAPVAAAARLSRSEPPR